MIENSREPLIAGIYCVALGGGLELALHAHYRVAARSAQLGLPEVTHPWPLLPRATGTQRLPRIVGLEKALETVAIGRPAPAKKALAYGSGRRLLHPYCPIFSLLLVSSAGGEYGEGSALDRPRMVPSSPAAFVLLFDRHAACADC